MHPNTLFAHLENLQNYLERWHSLPKPFPRWGGETLPSPHTRFFKCSLYLLVVATRYASVRAFGIMTIHSLKCYMGWSGRVS